MPTLEQMARSIVDGMPAALRRDFIRSRGGDRPVDHILEELGIKAGSHTKDALFGASGYGGFGANNGWAGSGGVPVAGNPQRFPQPYVPSPGAPASFGAAGGSGGVPSGDDWYSGGAGAANPGAAFKRIPFALWGGTDLAANEEGASADANDYTNGTGYNFQMTHASFSADINPVNLAPIYRTLITPGYTNQAWQKAINPIRVNALCDNVPYGPIQSSIKGYPRSVWSFDTPYVHGRNASMQVVGANESNEDVTLEVTMIGYKRNQFGTPRAWSSSLAIAANTTSEQSLNSNNFRGDGDADADIVGMILTGGDGYWGSANGKSPLVAVRPEQETAWMSSLVSAVALNNVPGALGAYWKLRTPQTMPTGTAMAIQLWNGSTAQRANIGFTGYLEIAI